MMAAIYADNLSRSESSKGIAGRDVAKQAVDRGRTSLLCHYCDQCGHFKRKCPLKIKHQQQQLGLYSFVSRGSKSKPVRKRCASIWAMILFWSKPASRFQGFLLLEHLQTSHSLKSVHCGKLLRPDAFTQAPTCCFTSAIILRISCSSIGISFLKSDKKRSVSNPSSLYPYSALPRVLRASLKSPNSLAIAALVTSDRCLLRTCALLRSALGWWRLGDDALRQPSILPMYSLAVLQTGVAETSTPLHASLLRL